MNIANPNGWLCFFIIFVSKSNERSMKQFIIFFNILLGLIWWGCVPNHIPSPTNNTIGNIQSRGIITASSLSKESEALFNASGGMTLTNAVFKYDGTQWGSSGKLLTIDSSKTTSLTAIYPAKNDENILITQNPYVENALEDILIAKHTFTEQTNIELEFRHLFAMLTIHVASPMNASLDEIAIEAPKVTSINGVNGTFETSNDKHTSTLTKNANGIYTFIIPSISACPLKIIFNPREEKLSHTLTHNFESGYKYECNVVGTDSRPGIKSTKEFIAFSYLINEQEPPIGYRGYALEDFRETINGRTTYRLLADITFTEAESIALLPIGYSESKAFKDIFDGEEHSISNLIIPDESTNTDVDKDYSGLFGSIESNGIVKNLHIKNASTIDTPKSSPIGGIAARNSGLIDNCSVQNSTFNEIVKVGGICGSLSKGYIINCYTTNNKFYLKNGCVSGGIVGDANGGIFNCYSYSNSYKNTVSGSYSGGIAGQCTSGEIYNCYLYQKSIPKYWGALLGLTSINFKYLTHNFLNNECENIIYSPKKTSIDNIQKYISDFKVNQTHISILLNDWIKTTGQTQYANLTFRTWKVTENGSACFE